MEKTKKAQVEWGWIVAFAIITILIFLTLWAWPNYRVYSNELRGKADFKEAEWNRQIATLDKEADIIRAEGIAESNRIISKTLTPEYIKWKWVEGLHDGSSEVIYVPTEANLPILEARG